MNNCSPLRSSAQTSAPSALKPGNFVPFVPFCKILLLCFLCADLSVLCVKSQDLNDPGFVAALNRGTLPAWAPTTPTNTLVEWLKADAMTMTDAAAVATWTNSAGLDATQASGTKQPLYKTNIKNGLPVVRFDGVNDDLATTDWTGSQIAAQPFTVICVFAFNAVSAAASAIVYDANATGAQRAALYQRPLSQAYFTYAGTAESATTVTTNITWQIATIEFNGASSTWHFNNGTKTTFGTNPGAGAPKGLTLGDDSAIGAFYARVDIGEIIVYAGLLNSSDFTSATNYFNLKWSVY